MRPAARRAAPPSASCRRDWRSRGSRRRSDRSRRCPPRRRWGYRPFQRAALFDMQFQIAVERTGGATRFADAIRHRRRSSRMASAFFTPFHTASSSPLSSCPATRAAAGEAVVERDAFFVCPDHHFERTARGDARLVQSPDHLDRARANPGRRRNCRRSGTESMCEPKSTGGQRRRRRRGARRCSQRRRSAA